MDSVPVHNKYIVNAGHNNYSPTISNISNFPHFCNSVHDKTANIQQQNGSWISNFCNSVHDKTANVPQQNDAWSANDKTVIASNLSSDLRGWDGYDTTTTEDITDESGDNDSIAHIPMTIPSMVLPWGGRDEHKNALKWKQRLVKRDAKRHSKNK